MAEIGTYRDYESWGDTDIVGFKVGEIGAIDEATTAARAGYLVVDTGPWIFGKKVLLPAGVVHRVDVNDERVYVYRTTDQIQNAPEFDEDRYRDDTYRTSVGEYYGAGRGYRDWD